MEALVVPLFLVKVSASRPYSELLLGPDQLMYRHYSYLAPQAYYPPGQPMDYEPPAPMPQQQPPNGAENNTQAVYQAEMLRKLAQASNMAGAAAQAALNGAVAGQPLGQPHVPFAPGVVPPSTDAIKNAIEMGQSAKGFPLKLPQERKQSQRAPGTSGIPSLPMGQPSMTGQPNRNPVPHPPASPFSWPAAPAFTNLLPALFFPGPAWPEPQPDGRGATELAFENVPPELFFPGPAWPTPPPDWWGADEGTAPTPPTTGTPGPNGHGLPPPAPPSAPPPAPPKANGHLGPQS